MKLQIIVGSVRPGRISSRIAGWAAEEAKTLADTTVEVVELAEYPMPLFDELIPPQYNPSRTAAPSVQKWLDKLAEADAYIIVTPEYNRALTGALKNALEYVDFQLANKPVGIIAHGSTGGAQAISTLRITVPALKGVTTPSVTMVVGRAGELFDDKGALLDEDIKENPYGIHAAMQGTLKEVKWYSDALAAAPKA
jgi:NAD(P)H-dependent FMN reductase